MLTLSKIESFEELLKLEDEWGALLEKSYSNTVFSGFEWVSNWWKCFGADRKLFVLVVKEGEEIVGIAPLMITKINKLGLSLNKMEFIGMPLSDYSDFIVSRKNKEVLQKIYDYLLENKNIWGFIKLNRIPEGSPTLDLSKEILKSENLFRVIPYDKCPCVIFKDATFKDGTKKNSVKKVINRLEREGELYLSICNDNLKEAKDLLNTFFEQHKQRWNSKGIPSMFNDWRYKQFYLNLIVSLLKKGRVSLASLRFNQKPIAFQLAFLNNNKYFAYSCSYDMNFARYSPGMVLTTLLIKYYSSHKFEEFDFLRGNEEFKLRLANKIRRNYSISLNKNLFLYILDSLSNKIENKIKEDKKLYNFFIKYEKRLRIF